MKWPSLIGKNGKNYIYEEKKFGRIDSRFCDTKVSARDTKLGFDLSVHLPIKFLCFGETAWNADVEELEVSDPARAVEDDDDDRWLERREAEDSLLTSKRSVVIIFSLVS